MGVWAELERIGDEEAWHRLESARRQGWLVAMTERPVRTLPVFGNLHRGKIEAISLALELDAGWLVVDDGDARKAAKSLGLRIIGLLGMRSVGQEARQVSKCNPTDRESPKGDKVSGFRTGDGADRHRFG